MADTQDGSFNLKHRLVGATILILVAVILLPRVLTGTGTMAVRSNANDTRVALQSQVQPQTLSNVSQSNAAAAEVRKEPKIEILDEVSVSELEYKAEANRVSDSLDMDSRKDQIEPAVRPTGLSVSQSIVTGWIAQVGIFQRTDNAEKLVADLKRDGIDAKTERIKMGGSQAVRIWLGPFSTRSEATREGNKAMMRTNTKPIVKEWP